MSGEDDKSPLWEAFYKVFLEEPKLWLLMKQYSLEAANAGWRHYSSRTIFERIRWHVQIETHDPDFKINDHWPPYYSRVFMWVFPQHGPSCWRGVQPLQRPWGVRKPLTNDGFFELRVIDTNTEVEQALYLLATGGGTMTEAEHTERAEAPEGGIFTWKRKRYFDGKTCGLKDCTKAPDGYIADKKPTKDHAAGRLWFGPVCQKCIDKTHPGMKPTSLAELAHQRHGASDLAGILDVEVGDVLRRLQEAGLNEQGRPIDGVRALTDQQQPQVDPRQQALPFQQTEVLSVYIEAVPIPQQKLYADYHDAQGVLARLQTFHVVDQGTLDIAGELTKMVKRSWNEIEEARLAIARPLRAKIEEVQAYFKPPLELLKQAEAILKAKMDEGMQRAQAMQQQALLAAQAAHQQGDYAARALATQAAVQADVVKPHGVTIQHVRKWRIVSPMHVPIELWSPDPAKIQAAVDAGYDIPGIEKWVENQIGVRVG